MMNGKEKIYFLLNKIDDKRETTPSGQPILIHPDGDLSSNYPNLELLMLFKKLQDDEKVLRVTRVPVSEEDRWAPKYEDDYFGLELLPTFESYFLKIQQEPKYQVFTGTKPPVQIKAKLNRKSLEKIWTILQEIETERGITSARDDISIPQVHFSKVKGTIGVNNASEERRNILRKLENEDYAIKDVRFSDNLQEDVYLKISDKYFEVYSKYEEAYKEAAKDFQAQNQQSASSYEITYTPSREVLLNKIYQLAKPDFDTENDLVFSYLYKNPNQKFTRQQIEEAIGKKLTKDLHKIVENLGFKSDLRKMFFSVSATSISFKNPITQEDIEALGIQKIKIS